jgi:secondary thiamine-phosphate synthase enzyme
LQQHQETLTIRTPSRGLHEVTREVAEAVGRSGIRTGQCTILLQHTSASLLIQENADPSARRDLERYLERIAPEGHPDYTHTAEGADDMPAHLRAALTHTSETIPIQHARLALGTWQGLYLCEHRRAPHRRSLLIHIIGEP